LFFDVFRYNPRMTKIDIFCGEKLAATVKSHQLDGQEHTLLCKAHHGDLPCEFKVRGLSPDNYSAQRTGNGCPVLKAITHHRLPF